jgi:fatty-acyl-CoA synthase
VDLMERERCTGLYTLPAMTRALLAVPQAAQRLATVRRGVTIGPPAEVRLLVEDLGVDLACNIYGSTETYGNCCVTPHDAPVERRIHSQGPPLPGVELRIHPDTGEIAVRGRTTPGYLDADGVPVAVVDPDGWFATGDLGRVDEDGWLTFAARETDMIKTSGINVSPSEVEDFLLTHPDVAEAVVAGGEDPVRGQRVVAFVRPRAGSAVTAEELRRHCSASISGYKVPAVVQLVTTFPTTQTGKLSRKDLSALATAALSGTGAERAGSGVP